MSENTDHKIGEINVVAKIRPVIFGGRIYVILDKETKIAVTLKTLSEMLSGHVTICGIGCKIDSYNPNENVMQVSGYLTHFDKKIIDDLVKCGWVPNEEGMRHHGGHIR